MLCDDMLTHYYECKETRLVASLLMDILAADERDQLTQLIGKYGVRDISQYDIHISECSAFMDYVRIYKGKHFALKQASIISKPRFSNISASTVS